jgi:3-methyladenine DNA glycosylase Mpg
MERITPQEAVVADVFFPAQEVLGAAVVHSLTGTVEVGALVVEVQVALL